jgi:hypothetical protein
MSVGSGLAVLKTSRARPAVVLVAILLAVLATRSATTPTDSQQYSVIARVDKKTAGLTSPDIIVRVENVSVPASAIQASPDIPRNIAIVIDAGPDQAGVLSKEKDLAVALLDSLSDPSTSFVIATAGVSSQRDPTTLDRSAAIAQARDINGDTGKKRNVAIYDAIASVIRQISLSPGLRVVIFIGEGNDGGSSVRFEELRSVAESKQIAFFVVLVADHSLRGTKSVLRYGWNLRQLADDSLGIFLENPELRKANLRFSEGIQGLRLVTFMMPSLQPGRYKTSIYSKRRERLKARRALVIP